MQPTRSVGGLADLRELQQRLLADDRLVQQHVVEHAARARSGRPGPARRPRPPRRSRCRASRGGSPGRRRARAAGLGEVATASGAPSPPNVSIIMPPVRLLVVRRPDLPHLALEPEQRARERERRAPLAGAGLGRQLPHAGLARCSRPAAPRCSACASRPARRPRTCSRCAPVCRAPSRAGARGTAATAATAGRRRAPRRGCRRSGRCETSWRMSVHREQRREVLGAGRLQRARVQRRAAAGSAGRARCCTSASASRTRPSVYLCRRTVSSIRRSFLTSTTRRGSIAEAPNAGVAPNVLGRFGQRAASVTDAQDPMERERPRSSAALIAVSATPTYGGQNGHGACGSCGGRTMRATPASRSTCCAAGRRHPPPRA